VSATVLETDPQILALKASGIEVGTLKTAAGRPLYGLVAEFETAAELMEAAKKTRDAGYVKTDAYSPFPIEHLEEALGQKHTKLSQLVFLGGLAGACGGFGLATWVSVFEYPMNIGGRPFFSWVSFVPITFECMVLLAAFTAVFGMIGLNGLPQPYHPIFNAKNFDRATVDRFFLCIEATDPKFDLKATESFLRGLKPLEVSDCAS